MDIRVERGSKCRWRRIIRHGDCQRNDCPICHEEVRGRDSLEMSREVVREYLTVNGKVRRAARMVNVEGCGMSNGRNLRFKDRDASQERVSKVRSLLRGKRNVVK